MWQSNKTYKTSYDSLSQVTMVGFRDIEQRDLKKTQQMHSKTYLKNVSAGVCNRCSGLNLAAPLLLCQRLFTSAQQHFSHSSELAVFFSLKDLFHLV